MASMDYTKLFRRATSLVLDNERTKLPKSEPKILIQSDVQFVRKK